MSGVGDRKICYGCRTHLAASAHGHRCQNCGRPFCGKCMDRTISVVGLQGGGGVAAGYGVGKPKFCEFCFQAIGREGVAMAYDERMDTLVSPRYFRVDRPPCLMEVQQGSPRSLRCSTIRSDEEDEEDIGKNFWSPCSVFSQGVSDIDSSSFSTNEFYSFKSLTPSPLDSPNRAYYEHGERSPTPTSQKADLPEQGSLDNLRTSKRVTGNQIENAYTNEYLSIYHDREGQEDQKPLNIEHNDSIWFPPPPEDEEDDAEDGSFEYDDEDDVVGHSGMLFPSSSFDDDEFPIKEKVNDTNKELLRASVHGHFRALVSQLLRGEGIPAGNDDGEEGWLEVVSSLAWQAANFVKPDTSRGGSMDPGGYVKVKCILSGSRRDSTLVKGVVCTKNVKLKRMISQHRNPRLLLLGGALEFQKISNKLASIETILQEEIDHLKMAVAKIEAHRPNVLLVENSVSSYAQEYLLAKEISLVLNVKRTLLERISRCTGAQIAPSIDNITSTRLGSCQIFRVERTTEECLSGNQSNKKSSRTLMFFEGCPRRLGCTVLLRGTCREELKKVKHVLQYASFAAYHLSLETSFLADSGAALPKMPLKYPAEIPDKMAVSDSILIMSDSANSMQFVNQDEYQALDSSGVYGTYHLPCLDVSSPKYSALYNKNEQEECASSNRCNNSSPACTIMSVYSQKRGLGSAISAPDLASYMGQNYGVSCEDMHGHIGLSTDLHKNEIDLQGKVPKKGGTKNPMQHEAGYEGRMTGMCVGSDVPVSGDYISASENQQSILVSLSSSCVLKGTICERSKLLRIKFYGNFDKPLGRYLRDDLFDQTSYCMCCKESPEAHVRCFTHQQGSLTISVKRLSSMKLPGEHDGRIWMWHRCLKCTHKDGVPPATHRVVMSDAAWGLSFGKFLELSFSNHATANRVASCGHSLQRDCLRFFGFGSMVAVFRYSPVDILSVQLPSSVLEFACQSQQEWFRREAVEVSSMVELFYGEVFDVLHGIEKKITNSVCEPSKASLYNVLMELKDLLKNERYKYDVLLQQASPNNFQTGQAAQDMLELNYLRRCLLIDSYIWDRRIYLLDSKVKGSSSEIDAHLLEISTHNDLMQRSESLSENVRAVFSPEGMSKKITKCNLNELVGMELSIKPMECHVNAAVADSVSDRNCCDLHMGCGAAVEESSLESLPSPGSSLSDKIDLAWTGTGHSVQVSATNVLGGIQDKRYRKLMSPARVYSFDSALRVRDRIHRDDPMASLHLSSLRSFDAAEDHGSFLRDPIPNIRRAYSQSSPRGIENLKFLFGHIPLYVSSTSGMVRDGARLLLPQTGPSNVVVAVYDKEPTSIIAYVLSSKEHTDFVYCSSDQKEDKVSYDQIKDGVGKLLSYNVTAATLHPFEIDDIQSRYCGSDEAPFSQGNVSVDAKQYHFRITFDDESSIPAEKAKFSVSCYFAKQFDALRRKCCPNELDFLCSLSRCRRWNAQGGKSNVYFAKSLDERFIIKQVTKTELDSFEEFAPRYFNYMMESINSGSPTCLAKILGIYQVTTKHLKGGREVKMDLMVMENLFFRRNIYRVYDLKGSSRSRYNSDTTGRNKVMLDLNLLEALRTKPIFLGSKAKRILERAIWNDTSFLASVDVMDYSLLVGVDEERQELVLGIIDYLREYTWDKHLETWVKASGILGGSANASPTVISPKQYKKRFRKAMSTYFLTVPDQWSS